MNSVQAPKNTLTETVRAPELSLFLPVLDEEENLRPMHAKIRAALDELGKTAEVIYVDDGSTDKSLQILREIASEDSRVRVISLRRNYGQTAAMSAGIDAAKGEILIPMDADLQNDPKDIARLLEKLNEGFDVVSGWRKNRQDKLISRKQKGEYISPLFIAILAADLNDREAVFGWLGECYEERNDYLLQLAYAPEFTRFHDDSRFQELLAKIKPFPPN